MCKKKKIDIDHFFEDTSRKILMCDGKKKYKTYNDAKFTADIECEQGRAKHLHVYECPYCHKWHLSYRV